ncbi:hypothetical protein HX900_26140 [Rhizobium sp. WYCCWR 11290]|uniref:Uncharacterized protein n=1 Tax=Rhizobium changzhiense TaxID=2692317 RepID=A0A7Z0ZUL1_9HYPH|nr:hypothetical protein [Rhizobium changzhiense]NZD64556.1 hypothetical protein [Rhizobium changzhiense]
MAAYDEAYERAYEALDSALLIIGRAVPRPSVARTVTGEAYRYKEQSPQQALVLKCVRMLSALQALKVLLNHRLVLDAGSMMRISDEIGHDIMFIAGPILFNRPPEARHKQFLDEFFQEEFGARNPLLSRNKRDRVSRRHIRAYNARTYSAPDGDTSKAVHVTELIDGVFSGFIHGAGAHIMDSFDGLDFQTDLSPGSHPLVAMEDQICQYIQRTIMAFCFSAMAIGRQDVFDVLYRLNGDLFDEYGELLGASSAQSRPRS